MTRSFIYLFILLFLPGFLQAQSQPQYRVKTVLKKIHRTNTWLYDDSVSYWYNGDHSGNIDVTIARTMSENSPSIFFDQLAYIPALGYDSAYLLQSRYTTPTITTTRQSFNAQGSLIERKLYNATQSSQPQLGIVTNFSYNNLLLTEIKATRPGIGTERKQIYTYNNGKVDSASLYTKPTGGSPYMLQKLIVYAYNNGLLSKMTTHEGGDSTLTNFSYDVTGRLISNIVMGKYLSLAYDTAEATYYSYNTAGDISEAYYWRNTPFVDTLAPNLKTVYTYDANHRLLTEVYSGDYYHNNSFDTFAKRSYIYNGQLLTETNLKRWNNNQWVDASDTSLLYSSNIVTFDYEMYWPTSVAQTNVTEPAVKLYPSPSSDFIRVEAVWKEEKPFEAMICDMQGRVIRQWQEPANRLYNRTIPIPELPAGVYILKMQCVEESFSRQFVKQ